MNLWWAELLTHDHLRQLLTDARSPQTLTEAVDVSAEWIREEDRDRERHSGTTSMDMMRFNTLRICLILIRTAKRKEVKLTNLAVNRG